jgi:hypothetical protein
MLIDKIYIVADDVRVYDVDGSYIELCVDDALDFKDWVLQWKERLLEIKRRQNKAKKEETVE